MQAKDVPELPLLDFIAKHPGAIMFAGFPNSVLGGMPDETPMKVALAKMRALIRRGLVDGCGCGCRGDFGLTRAGQDYLREAAR